MQCPFCGGTALPSAGLCIGLLTTNLIIIPLLFNTTLYVFERAVSFLWRGCTALCWTCIGLLTTHNLLIIMPLLFNATLYVFEQAFLKDSKKNGYSCSDVCRQLRLGKLGGLYLMVMHCELKGEKLLMNHK